MGSTQVHTPGPWEEDDRWPFAVVSQRGIPGAALGLVVIAQHVKTDTDRRLIAAAPDLLAACKEAAQLIEDLNAGDGPLMGNTFDKLAAAIAKAEGGAA